MNYAPLQIDDIGWHPKLTVYRLSIITVTITLATVKAFCPPASATVEWMAGIHFFLLVFFLSYRDGDPNAEPSWLFGTDLVDTLRNYLKRFGVSIPHYSNKETAAVRRVEGRRARITGHRLLVSVTAITFGTTKAYLSFTGEDTAPKFFEWVYSAILSMMLYWVGLYGHSPGRRIRWLFTDNYAAHVSFLYSFASILPGFIILGWCLIFVLPFFVGNFKKEFNPAYDQGRWIYLVFVVVPFSGFALCWAIAAMLCLIGPAALGLMMFEHFFR